MTDIKKYTNNIRTAIYGKEVRESLATGIEVINTEVEENTKHVNETVKDIEQFKKDIDSSERQRVSNENTRIANEETRKEEFKKIVDKNGTWDKQLSDLYNTNNSSLDSLNNNLNALHKSFQSKYDNLEKEYAQEITDVKNVQGQPKANYKIDSLGIHPSSNGFIDDFKLFGKTVIVNNLNEEVEPGTAGAILKSVGDGVDNIEISAIKADNNLFNPNECINKKYVADGGVLEVPSSNPTDFNVAFIKIPIGDFSITISGLTNSVVTGNQSAYIGFYDKNKNPINSSIFNVKNPFTKTFTNSVIGFIAVTVKKENLGTLNVTIGNEVKPYTQYEGSKRNLLYYDSNAKVWEKPILRSANKLVKDTIESSNNKVYYHQKCMELTLNGNENWVFDGDLGNTVRCYLRNSNLKPGLVTSNSLNSIQNYVLDKEHIYASEGFLWVFLSKSKATDLNTFKNYFKGTPTTVVCPMIKEEVYECLDISTRSFNPKTLFLVNGGAVSPEVEAYMPNSLISSVRSISEKLENVDDSLLKLMFDFLGHKHDSRYERIDLGTVKDFNTALTPGKYWVAADDKIPNGPYGGGIWGYLEVSSTSETETAQTFTSSINGSKFFRLLNFQGKWTNWTKTPVVTDFVTGNVEGKHYAIFPNGLMIQWGNLILNFPGGCNNTKGYVYFPKTFTSDFIFTGSLARNNWAGYSETIAVLAEDNSSRGFVEARCIDSSVYPTSDKTVTINWIAIGRY
ncbi:Uncharacterised protein [[Clostridium] sordellii]|uniref:gp53-like domain-containing protein n=1 Tax=Paraclostridium sordellii TaxID=1505 RepID=UPI0005E22446|nr:hypothetical protein [Paeniclostridium sordellii]CEN23109.1 Uncharacterised protein [[Clostridium] sordellii] [Paeniclostridium sordellii]CEN24056.1 Uncharacterised protein [[Clostridium] sordellii] [Paeniclostridium sordellii]CEQ32260.1 Uncharacterised protein [[Clostridium] sordellii] [Paeniclostridium sordellii]